MKSIFYLGAFFYNNKIKLSRIVESCYFVFSINKYENVLEAIKKNTCIYEPLQCCAFKKYNMESFIRFENTLVF